MVKPANAKADAGRRAALRGAPSGKVQDSGRQKNKLKWWMIGAAALLLSGCSDFCLF
jgi:hypothetical protein